MPKNSNSGKRGHRKLNRPSGKSGSDGKTASLEREIRDVTSKADAALRKGGQLAKKSAVVYEAADEAHRRAESTHLTAETTHKAIHNLGQFRPAKAPVKNNSREKKAFTVVGVGASAGGFEAFVQLLENLPPDLNMAFVFVQHLDPRHASSLASLLSSKTQMEVTEIRQRTQLSPNHIYIIPPNTSLIVSNGVLRLSQRKKGGVHMPIDTFFKSVAQDQGNLAVGIILSGNATDGTAGLKEIKAGGGLTFAQEPASCKFPGMPESAIISGCVDYVLTPSGIAAELAQIAAHGVVHRGLQPNLLPGAESHLARIFALIRAATGADFSCYKPTTLRRRIMRRMVLRKIETLPEYFQFLQNTPAEIELLFQDILINVTGFFRDPSAFQVLKKKIFPRIVKAKPPGEPIRVWVPGCATGEEVYSLAICLHEFLGKNLNNKAIQIFGTDINENMVAKARAGVYPLSVESEVSPERLRRYFEKSDGGYRISKFIRDACIFARQNVAEDPPFSKLDLISCRNLLIYLGLPLQQRVFPTFHYSLRPGGYLLLGTSETIGAFSNLFTLVDKKNKVYTRNETYTRPEVEFTPNRQTDIGESKLISSRPEVSHFNLQKRAEEILLGQYSPPGVVVNARMEVLHFLGRTGPYLEPATGSASLNLLKMVRDELAMDVRTALTQATRTNLPVRKEGVRMRFERHLREVTIDVVPFKNSAPDRFFMVLFRNHPQVIEEFGNDRKKSQTTARQQQAERESTRLRSELRQTRESLQTIIEQQEATNEELKSANEEIQSSNEELQSTNEELETAKEELQSTNEELTTLNEELQNRNGELSQANNDLNNLIGSFNMPIVMLGNDMTIRRFTPLAQKIFNLIPGDVGRRISDINPNIALPDLSAMVTEVVDSLHIKEIEVQDREGHWYSLRIRPYRTSENKIDGAVIVLVDIGDVRQGLEEVLDMVPEPMLLLTNNLRVSKANNSFYEKFQVETADTLGHLIFELGNGQWNAPPLRSLLESVLPGNQHVENFKLEHDFPMIGRRTFLVNARRLYQQSKGTHYVLVLLKDIGK
jgi:two-component system CheB/CheR fusion protein